MIYREVHCIQCNREVHCIQCNREVHCIQCNREVHCIQCCREVHCIQCNREVVMLHAQLLAKRIVIVLIHSMYYEYHLDCVHAQACLGVMGEFSECLPEYSKMKQY